MIKHRRETVMMTDKEHKARARSLIDAAVITLHAAEEHLGWTERLKDCGTFCDEIATAREALRGVRRRLS